MLGLTSNATTAGNTFQGQPEDGDAGNGGGLAGRLPSTLLVCHGYQKPSRFFAIFVGFCGGGMLTKGFWQSCFTISQFHVGQA